MKRIFKILLKSLLIFIGVVLLLLIVIPTFFKDTIKEKVVQKANQSIEATVAFDDFSLSFIRNFPNLRFSLKGVSVTGKGAFEGEKLAGFKSFSLVFDLSSILKKSGYDIRSIIIDSPVANAIVLENGMANWDIIAETSDSLATVSEDNEANVRATTGAEGKKINARLRQFRIQNGNIMYDDRSSGMLAVISNLNISLTGNMSQQVTDLKLDGEIGGVTFAMDGIKYLNDAGISTRIDVEADLENKRFTLGENSFSVNEIMLTLTGMVEMEGDSIITDLDFATGETGFKPLLSLIPELYKKDFSDLKADGLLKITGQVKGTYNKADSIMPDASVNLIVTDGSVNYPALPGSVDDIQINFKSSFNGTDQDKSIVDLEHFHMKLAGNPFDLKAKVITPISDPGVSGSARGKIELKALKSALPINAKKFTGTVNMMLDWGGNLSSISDGNYDRFRAEGIIGLSEIEVKLDSLPPIAVPEGEFSFSPDKLSAGLSVNVAGSVFNLNGELTNWLPFIMKGATVKGNLALNSPGVDVDEIMSYMPESGSVTEEKDTSAIAMVTVPANIDFTFGSTIDSFKYSPLEATDIRGNIILRDGTIRIEETGLKSLGGEVTLSAIFDTRDTLNPSVDAALDITGIGIKPVFETFNTVRRLAPVADGMDGNVNLNFTFSGTLGEGMVPVVESISGTGRLNSKEIQLVGSPLFSKFSEVLKLGNGFSNTLKDVDVRFTVSDGRVFIKPFDTKLGVMNVNISGDHGLDQTINYLVKTEMPSKYIPGAMKTLVSAMAAQAALLGIKYTMPETVKLNASITGTVKEPRIAPSLGSGQGGTGTVTDVAKEQVKELVKGKTDEVKDKVNEAARAEADKIMAAAEEQAGKIKAGAAEAAAKIRAEADSKAQKLIDEADSKGTLARIAAGKAAEKIRSEADNKATRLEEEASKKADDIIAAAKKKSDVILTRK